MTRVMNDPSEFASDAVAGMCRAYPRYLSPVHGGVVRSTASPSGQVAVVIGGGSGHYPAFAGWVGPGMAHGAVCGNVFASPSGTQVYSVATTADNGGGIVMSFGNYAGDVLQFGQAAERLRAEGYAVETIAVSDDIASGGPDDLHKRRGVAGDLVVFKILGAAAERGYDLARVTELGWRANDCTRSYGVAFDGCTLPGADEALFHVPSGQMSIGLGVHGEPGIDEVAMGSASEIADLLCDGVLGEMDAIDSCNGHAVVLLNGLGTVKPEELYVTYNQVARRLDEAGLTPVLPEVGELMTSLDMAGVSLTVTFLDDELEELWTDPVDTVAFRRGGVAEREPRQVVEHETQTVAITEGSDESQACADTIIAVLDQMAATTREKESEWGHLDAVAGDGDHGQGMRYGIVGALEAATEARKAKAGAATLLIRAGAQWSESAGGTSGALWAAIFTAMGDALSDDRPVTSKDIASGVRAADEAVQRLGGAQPGDKTIVDALSPFASTLTEQIEAGSSLGDAWRAAVDAADEAAQRTSEFVARLGRSRVLGTKSLGIPDPGAVSFVDLMRAISSVIG